MKEKRDFLSELAEEVSGEVESIDQYEPVHQNVHEENWEDLSGTPKKEEPVAVKPEPVKKSEPAPKKDRLVQPSSFEQETFHQIQKPKRTLSKGAKIAFAVVAAVVVALVVWFKFLPHIVMPQFTGKKLTDVSTWAKQEEISSNAIGVGEAEYSLEYDKDVIISQSVEAGTKIKKDTPITFILSKGPDPEEEISFPDIKSMTQSEINAWAQENKLSKTKISSVYSTTIPAGEVISYDLKDTDEGSFKRNSTLSVVCSKGPAPAGQVTVENFVNKTFAEMQAWANAKKVTLDKQEQYSDSVEAGNVVSQSVKANETIKEGDTLIVVVSKGKGVSIPQLVGYTKEQLAAWTARSENDVTIVTKSLYNEAPEGSVIGQSLAAGTVVDSGTVLELTISLYLPILQTSSRAWYGRDYLELKAWVDEVNSKGANIQAGEWGENKDPVCPGDSKYENGAYMTPGQIVQYSCLYGTNDTEANGCSRPLNLDSRISYRRVAAPEEYSKYGCKVGAATTPTPEPAGTGSGTGTGGSDSSSSGSSGAGNGADTGGSGTTSGASAEPTPAG